ncbi:hypothetical protein ACJX0J_013383, partial [Zea mays]
IEVNIIFRSNMRIQIYGISNTIGPHVINMMGYIEILGPFIFNFHMNNMENTLSDVERYCWGEAFLDHHAHAWKHTVTMKLTNVQICYFLYLEDKKKKKMRLLIQSKFWDLIPIAIWNIISSLCLEEDS